MTMQELFSGIHVPGLEYKHNEDGYVDLIRERLIPHNLSAEGPALVSGDINGDGLEDLFVGGAKGESAKVFIQQKDGSFKLMDVPTFVEDRFSEDVDAVLFDADGDGDLDLYVVRGGNEVPIENPFLADRLLMNDGGGGLKKSEKGSLPYLAWNGSCVRPGDYDGDGDLDLFVGSRSVPGAYGLLPHHFLLENDGQGHFTDATARRMPGLEEAGMITDAAWLDYDMDGDQDLVLVGEWINVRIYRNDSGLFNESTIEAGLGETSGWWNCIELADVDQDGDLDLIGGNLGLNSTLKASIGAPVEMYVNDFDNNGSLDQIICAYDHGISYPVASLDELASQIADLKRRYPNYADFGGKTPLDIFGKKKLEESIYRKAVIFENSLFMNNGDGTFELEVLPKISQSSPVRDVMVRDIDGDGLMDLLLVGNNYEVRPSLGRYDASYGWCLLGESGPETRFSPMMPAESGLVIHGDARRIVPIEISGHQCLVVAVNDGFLQIFQVR